MNKLEILQFLEQARDNLPPGFAVTDIRFADDTLELYFEYTHTTDQGTTNFCTYHDLEEIPDDQDIVFALVQSINTAVMVHHLKTYHPELQIIGGDYFKNQLYLQSPYSPRVVVRPILNECYDPKDGKFSSARFAIHAELFNYPNAVQPTPAADAKPRLFTPKVHNLVRVGSKKPGIPLLIYQPFMLSMTEQFELVVLPLDKCKIPVAVEQEQVTNTKLK